MSTQNSVVAIYCTHTEADQAVKVTKAKDILKSTAPSQHSLHSGETVVAAAF